MRIEEITNFCILQNISKTNFKSSFQIKFRSFLRSIYIDSINTAEALIHWP